MALMSLAKKALKSGKNGEDEARAVPGVKKAASGAGKLALGVAKRTRLGQRLVAEGQEDGENGNGLVDRLKPIGTTLKKAATALQTSVRGRRT
jgi:hypothetical protein